MAVRERRELEDATQTNSEVIRKGREKHKGVGEKAAEICQE